jgi:hypothetical protein
MMGRPFTTHRIDRRLVIGAIFIALLFLRPRWEAIHPSDGIILRVFGAVLMTILFCRLTSWNPVKRPSAIELWADATEAAARGAPRPSHWAAGAVINLACTLVACFVVAHVFVFESNHLCGSTAAEQKSAPILRTSVQTAQVHRVTVSCSNRGATTSTGSRYACQSRSGCARARTQHLRRSSRPEPGASGSSTTTTAGSK